MGRSGCPADRDDRPPCRRRSGRPDTPELERLDGPPTRAGASSLSRAPSSHERARHECSGAPMGGLIDRVVPPRPSTVGEAADWGRPAGSVHPPLRRRSWRPRRSCADPLLSTRRGRVGDEPVLQARSRRWCALGDRPGTRNVWPATSRTSYEMARARPLRMTSRGRAGQRRRSASPFGRARCRTSVTDCTHVRPRPLQRADADVVRGCVRGADAGPGGRVGRDRARQARAGRRADRQRQDAQRLPPRDRPAAHSEPPEDKTRRTRVLYISPAQGARRRRRAQPPRAR